MRSLIITTLLVFSAGALSARQLSTDFELKNSGNLEIASGGSATIELQVRLPDDHHIYVKHASALSMNIVTSFSIPENEGFGVEIKKEPETQKYETDYILKGKGRNQVAGTYELEIFEQKGRSAAPRIYTVPLVIKSQMCDSRTNICFRPQEFKKLLRIKIQGDKVSVNFRSTSSINWITSYDEAFQKAKATGKNVFVVITAPDWCGYCRYLERDVFSKSTVAESLNQGFVALRILDTNSDKNKFQFNGYPTMKIADSSGKIIKEGGIGRQETSFLAAIAPFAKSEDVDGPEIIGSDSYSASLSVKFYKEGNGWVMESPLTGKESYEEARRDEKYIILKSAQDKFLAIPLNGDQGYYHDGKKWIPAFKVD